VGRRLVLETSVLIAHARRIGKPRGARDLIIASHAVETDQVVLSRDAGARFGDLPGVVTIPV
jgi:predicted nucleic acid-binding protein